MRQFTVGLLSVAGVLTAIAWSSAIHTQGQEYFTVRAGPVANAKISALSGDFQVLKVGPGNGIPSPQLGGACLIFDPGDLGLTELASRRCDANSQCQGGGASAGYCDGQTHSCWARPIGDPLGAGLCNKGKVFEAHVVNSAPVGPIDVAQYGVRPGAKARVVACLNKTGFVPGLNGTGCPSIDGPDRVEVLGPIAIVKP